jgi:hypothetical protein
MGDITHFYLRSTGETRRMPKSSVSEFVDEHMKQQERREDVDRAVQEAGACRRARTVPENAVQSTLVSEMNTPP